MHLSFNVLTGMGSHEVESISGWVVDGAFARTRDLTSHGHKGVIGLLMSTCFIDNMSMFDKNV